MKTEYIVERDHGKGWCSVYRTEDSWKALSRYGEMVAESPDLPVRVTMVLAYHDGQLTSVDRDFKARPWVVQWFSDGVTRNNFFPCKEDALFFRVNCLLAEFRTSAKVYLIQDRSEDK